MNDVQAGDIWKYENRNRTETYLVYKITKDIIYLYYIDQAYEIEDYSTHRFYKHKKNWKLVSRQNHD